MGFHEMAAIDKRHREEVGYRPRPNLSGRALDLAGAIRPSHKIKPVLDSRYLVKGWLDRGAASVLYGDSNVGKTFFALDLAAHVAAGEDWHGHRVPSGEKWAGPVIYVASEGGTGINNRLEAMRRTQPELMQRVDANGDLCILSAPIDLCTAEDAAYLAEAISEEFDNKPSLIVVDTLARAMGNGDENTAKDMGQFVRNIDLLREATGAHVMVIHHSGKDASRGARGSGSLRAAVDTEIELTRADGIIMAEARKQRDMACDGVFAFTLKSVFLGMDDDGDRVTSAVVEQTDIQRTDKRQRLSGRAQVALDTLKEVVADKGRIIKSPNLPNVPVVEMNAWRAACDRVGLTDSDDPKTQARIFRRHRDTLMDKDRIRIWESYVWLADKADRQRTPADKSATQADGHGHPPIRGVPCPATSSTSHDPNPSQANTPLPQAGARIPLPDPDTFDPEMWR
ncbi:AAA family ATPase [Paracoccus salipaludis]|uniref:AAA+ ATPase domain-containing protein n=1 Tax=Paracoccus salipaludis TaxID=2032623 RepID=A0A2A2GHL6_9RHOB|nr:helicase RepA family protein [Paracoccus salipaludis]PAU96700.1 hypothetical protein CK240_12420 [Paracoccus salipaludis]